MADANPSWDTVPQEDETPTQQAPLTLEGTIIYHDVGFDTCSR